MGADEFGEISAAELASSGLLVIGEGAHVSPHAVFAPADVQGAVRPIEIGPGCQVGAFAVICGGTVLRERASVEEHALVGKPENGYAVGHVYPGAGARTVIGLLLAVHPVGPDIEPQARSQQLARIRRELAAGGHLSIAVPTSDGAPRRRGSRGRAGAGRSRLAI